MNDAVFLEARGNGTGHKWLVRVMRAGLSGNGNFYGDGALREAIPMFEGVRVFVKSDEDHLRGRGKDVRNLVGRLSGAHFVEGTAPDTGEVRANLEVLDTADGIAARLREAWERGMSDMFGLSIDATGRVRAGRRNGASIQEATKFTKVSSVDLIVEPGAGGKLLNLVEALQEDHRDMALREKMLRFIEAERPGVFKRLDTENISDEDLEKTYREAVEAKSKAGSDDSGTVKGLGDDGPAAGVRLVEGRDEKVAGMLDAFFNPDDRSVTSFRECYVDITGDRRLTGQLRNCDQSRLREALDSASFTDVLGDSITRRMLEEYRREDQYSIWRELALVDRVNDFRTQERTRIGGYGDLPDVAENAPYTAMTSPTDEKATYAVSKRGGTETITLEMIANDDMNAIQRIPLKLAMAAKRTLSKFVLDFLDTNPLIYDGLNLFDASHNNLSANALGAAEVSARRLAMKGQTELNSGDRLGIGPRYLWVSDDEEEKAVDLFRRNTENDRTFLQSLTLQVMPVWYWTDPNNWYLSADKRDIPSVQVGFFNGNEEPELFVQDSPTQGSMFTHDQVSYKIRHIYGGAVTDFRGLQGAIVA